MALWVPICGILATFENSVMAESWTTHSSSGSMYLHSNDTFTLRLTEESRNQLQGSPGSQIDLTFV